MIETLEARIRQLKEQLEERKKFEESKSHNVDALANKLEQIALHGKMEEDRAKYRARAGPERIMAASQARWDEVM
jgi:hypothetical protein